MNNKKLYIILSALVVIICFLVILLSKFAFYGWDNGTVVKNEITMKSRLGDKFTLRYVTKDFPDISTAVTIFDESDEKIVYFVINGEFYESDLVLIVDSQEIRCYEAYEVLIYKIANTGFTGVPINRIDKLKPDEYPFLIPVTKMLTQENDWKWISVCGGFLLRAGDDEMRKTLEQYALGQFEQEELETNKDSELTREEMQTLAHSILGEQ